MPGINTLVDNFNDNTVNPALWSGSYGTYQEAGGRARVACDTAFNAYKSATSYTLTGSSVFLQVYAPAAAGASSSTCTMFVTSSTAGTDAGFLIDTAGNAVGVYLRSGFADGAPVFLTYNPTAHAWLRLRETAGTLYWETAPDGATWTVQRTAATPAWAANADLALFMDSHRDAGTNNWTEYDNLNALPGQTVAASGAAETDTGQAVGRRKTRAISLASGVDAAQPTARTKTRAAAPAQNVDAAQQATRSKTKAVTPAAETGTAVTAARTKTLSATLATETATAVLIGRAKTTTPAPAVQTSTAGTLASIKTKATAYAAETDSALTPGRVHHAAITPAVESTTALPPAPAKRRTPGRATETDLAVPALTPGSTLTHRLQLTGPPTTPWTTHGTTTPWTCTGRTTPVDALSTEYYEIGVTWTRGTPTALPTQIAIMPIGHEPATGDWHDATWDTNADGTTVAKLLVGPDGGALAPTPGRYRAWVNVTATPEHPVLATAAFDIT